MKNSLQLTLHSTLRLRTFDAAGYEVDHKKEEKHHKHLTLDK